MEEQIKEQMKFLTLKWEGKDPQKGSVEYARRQIDRMIYRTLKRKLEKLVKTGGKQSTEDIAKEVFEVD